MWLGVSRETSAHPQNVGNIVLPPTKYSAICAGLAETCKETPLTKICDYEGSRYRSEFWESGNRAYEDAVERVAMKKLLPPTGNNLIEIGAGFGRLVDLYQGYRQIVLLDYARTQLEEAQRYLGHDDRFIFVVADVYNLPFVSHLFNTLTMVRVMHHLVNVPGALAEIQRILRPQGIAVVEHANKLNLKAIARWTLGRQDWSPFDPAPIEFVELNFNFHPAWMRRQFAEAGLPVQKIRTLSHYRIDVLKRWLPTWLLVRLDSLAQPTGRWWQLAPSVFLQAQAQKPAPPESPAGFFRCPTCKSAALAVTGRRSDSEFVLTCHQCRRGWSFAGGIYDFKTPVQTPA
ncbi:MAG: class I SAM-dependent methyltransferase [Chloroflexi bacterium]|nr:MAG: class I SAM-dependent methyltransferase [Chloroflexota bacterium]